MSHRSGVMGGYETAAAVLFIIFASLSAWGAFLIYRVVKGQRGERCSKENTSGTEKEPTRPRGGGGDDEDEWSKSTGSDDGISEDWDVDSDETKILSHASHTKTSLDLLEENLEKTSHETVKKLTAKSQTGSPVRDTTGTGKDHRICRHDVFDAAESISAQSDLFVYQDNSSRPSGDKPEISLKENACDDEESEIEQHIDVDEPSETESAQEIMEAKNLIVQKSQSVDDLLDNTLLVQDIMSKPNEEEIIVADRVVHISSEISSSEALHKKTKMDEPEVTTKAFERNIPLMIDLDSYCFAEQSDPLNNLESEKVKQKMEVKSCQDFNGSINSLQTTVSKTDDCLATQQHLSNTFGNILSSPPQNYLGFTVAGLQVDLLPPLPLTDQSKDKTEVTPADISQKKNEISIMDAIMDSNEWLSTGPPDTRDLPWLTQTLSKASCGFKADVSSSPVPATAAFGLPADVMSHRDKTDLPENTTTAEAKDEVDLLNKKVGTVLPMPQLVKVSFRVHYITHSPKQILAVTGNQQELGFWESFVPLSSVDNGFWFCTISLPLDSQVEWKFILVEEGKIQRWEECENRCFAVTGQEEEIHLNKNWGYA
ncbi:uncharacterized protein stbd1 [Tachysurus vachellii]|uniref:uncharacterized protein stbd1 n=1 Tax=Tachysurus vachellii TaxID=175792 RepID=UPI00296A9D56|nr:uncharacterized protein stbd1 [Tachysurus vachellii]